MRTGLAIAALALLEARRSRLLWLFLAAAGAALGAGLFAGALALAETRETRVAVAAPMLRLAAVFIVSGFIAASMAREADERMRALLLALPVPRTHFVLARLAGYGTVAWAAAFLCTLAVLPFAAPRDAVLWGLSLASELSIVAAFALFAAAGLRSVLAAQAATLGFYLLARAAAGLQALGRDDGAGRLPSAAIDAVALLLPRLDTFARTDWLAYGTAGIGELGYALAQGVVYVALLGAACAFDLQRREIE